MSCVLIGYARLVNEGRELEDDLLVSPIRIAWQDKGLNDSGKELALGLSDNAR